MIRWQPLCLFNLPCLLLYKHPSLFHITDSVLCSCSICLALELQLASILALLHGSAVTQQGSVCLCSVIGWISVLYTCYRRTAKNSQAQPLVFFDSYTLIRGYGILTSSCLHGVDLIKKVNFLVFNSESLLAWCRSRSDVTMELGIRTVTICHIHATSRSD